MKKRVYELSKFEIGLLVVNVAVFAATLALFIYQHYQLAMYSFVFFALCSIGLVMSIYDSAADCLSNTTEDLTNVTARLLHAKEQIEKNDSSEEALLTANQKKEKLELKNISIIKMLEEQKKELAEKDRIINELRVQLEFKNRELNETVENADKTHEALLAQSLLPDPQSNATEMINIIKLAKEAADEIREYAGAAGIEIRFSCKSDSLMVKAERAKLHILFKNIMDNSVKYMGRSGQLVITISAVEDIIFIVLKDNGNGLATEEVAHIFELNYQGSNRISGNGLGLTQAKAIVEYYGGTIYAKSSKDSGMAIYIQLPAN